MKHIGKFGISLLLCLGAAWVGSIFTVSAIPAWYTTLARPTINPPNWIFAPVWTILYVLMGISLFLVWQKNWKVSNFILVSRRKAWNKWSEKFWMGNWQKQNVIAIFAVQLALNVLWSYIFFGRHQIGLAFFEILALWFAILYTIVNFYRISKPAAYLLIPYVVWVTFAGFLNYSLWILNK